MTTTLTPVDRAKAKRELQMEALKWLSRVEGDKRNNDRTINYKPIPLTNGHLLHIKSDPNHCAFFIVQVVNPVKPNEPELVDDRFTDFVLGFEAAKKYLEQTKRELLSDEDYETLFPPKKRPTIYDNSRYN